jgi:hypothetical protein
MRVRVSFAVVSSLLAAALVMLGGPASASAVPTGSFDSATGVLTINFPATEFAYVGVDAWADSISVCNTCSGITDGVRGDAVRSVVIDAPAGFELEVAPGFYKGLAPIPITMYSTSQRCTVRAMSQNLPTMQLTSGPNWIRIASPAGPQLVTLHVAALSGLLVEGTPRSDDVDASRLKLAWEHLGRARGSFDAPLRGGDNVIRSPDAPRSYLGGGAGNDHVWAMWGQDDEIALGDGNNVVHSGPGDDLIATGDGNDRQRRHRVPHAPGSPLRSRLDVTPDPATQADPGGGCGPPGLVDSTPARGSVGDRRAVATAPVATATARAGGASYARLSFRLPVIAALVLFVVLHLFQLDQIELGG